MFTIAGTGPRELVLDDEYMEWAIDKMTYLLFQATAHHGEVTVVSGMAEGWDEALAKAAIQAQVPFHAYVPSPDYGRYYWGQKSLTGRDRFTEFSDLVTQCSKLKIVERWHNNGKANFQRNSAMIAVADKIWTPDIDFPCGGTADTIAKAMRQGVSVYRVSE